MRACTLGGRHARLAAFVAWIETRDPILLEAPFPTRDGRSGCAQAAHDLDVSRAVSHRQNQPRAEDITAGSVRDCAHLANSTRCWSVSGSNFRYCLTIMRQIGSNNFIAGTAY
jgi:hypothetical protein